MCLNWIITRKQSSKQIPTAGRVGGLLAVARGDRLLCACFMTYRFNPVLGFLSNRRIVTRAQRRAHCMSSLFLSRRGGSLCEPPPPPLVDTVGVLSIPTKSATAMPVNSLLDLFGYTQVPYSVKLLTQHDNFLNIIIIFTIESNNSFITRILW